MAQAQAPAGAPKEGSQVAAHAPHQPGFPPFQANTFGGQLLWFAIAFGLLYYFMSKVALPKIGAVLEDRRSRIARDLEEAQAMRQRSEEAEAAYQLSLTEARDRSKGIAQEMRDKLTAESDVRRRALEAELAEKIAASEATIRSRTTAAMSNVRGIAADAATAIVERVTGRAPDRAVVDAALDRTLR
ncbi:F0F1 ATP synthase subunit B' [Enterovirga sp.]|jgi:F-type H+-transporting ATPase subunit b|uniref:F0F1 ATP synthase subunit B family protein n=1 Tax=Enterovirga sp. TaxID=2026350 RepID=UPI002A6085B8|nr:H+transporting two-sector ATPase subunit [Enterovirga sp.]